MRLDILPHGLRQFPGRRRGVFRDRHAPERRHHLGQHRAVERNSGNGKRRRHGRVRMHDRLHVRTLLVDLEVHLHLGRGLPLAGDLVPFEIGDHHHLLVHEAFADVGGRHQQPVFIQPHADVAVVRRGVAARVQASTHFHDV